MAYTACSVVYGEQPTAAKWNQLGANDAGFRDGTNIDTGVIGTSHLAAGAVTAPKLALAPQTSFVATTESTSGTSWQSLATPQAITINLPAGANILVLIQAQATTSDSQITVELSGTNTAAPTLNDNLGYDNGAAQMLLSHKLFTGLNAGNTTFTMRFGLTNARSFLRRRMTIIPLGV